MANRILRFLIGAVLLLVVEPLFAVSERIRNSNIPPPWRRRLRMPFEFMAALTLWGILMLPAWLLSCFDEDW